MLSDALWSRAPAPVTAVADFRSLATGNFRAIFMPKRPTALSSEMGPEGLG
jgi:hypothetical protein